MSLRFKGILFSLLLLSGSLAMAVPSEEAFMPIPTDFKAAPTAELGKKLFADKRLSSRGDKSCQSCHQPNHGFSQPYRGGFDTPSLWNVAFMDRYFWNGRTRLLSEAIKENLISSNMLGSEPNKILQIVQADPELSHAFKQRYKSGVTFENIVHALQSYLETLNTPNTRFDKFIQGDVAALSQEEKKGYDLFVSYGCASCHQGRNVGGNLMEKMGIYHNYFTHPNPIDLGWYTITENKSDRFVFRVPSLRNVTKTAPYFHDGSAKTLASAIKQMAYYQLNRDLHESEISSIATFLESLTLEESKE